MVTKDPYNKVNKCNNRPQILCPHCKSNNLRIRSSEQAHSLLKKIWLQCPNLFCGFSCGGNIEITHEISPSAVPNPTVHLMTLKEIALRKAENDEKFNNENEQLVDGQ